jgi:hypothetical protein
MTAPIPAKIMIVPKKRIVFMPAFMQAGCHLQEDGVKEWLFNAL